MKIDNESLKWFNNARFGMFIHWGLYSLQGRGEWAKYLEDIPSEECKKIAEQFNPKKFRPEEWVAIAKAAGMKYMVLTTKHHDGFCLFDSKYTEFTSVKTVAKRDFIAEYVEACRNAGLGVGLYFSVKDWSFPAYFIGPEKDPKGWNDLVAHFHNQALELMTNYGKIDILFYDGADDANIRGWGDRIDDKWRSELLNKKIRELQPGILINDRSGVSGDYGTPEQEIPHVVNDEERFYECCITMNNSWGYNKADNNWKSTQLLIQQLTTCAALGNNYLLNVGPDSDGVIPRESVERLYDMGSWLNVHGEAIYGTERVLPNYWNWWSSIGLITTKGNFAYVLMTDWKPEGIIVITRLKNQVKSASLMASGRTLEVRREGRRIIISGLPIHAPSNFINIVKLELDGKPEPQYYY